MVDHVISAPLSLADPKDVARAARRRNVSDCINSFDTCDPTSLAAQVACIWNVPCRSRTSDHTANCARAPISKHVLKCVTSENGTMQMAVVAEQLEDCFMYVCGSARGKLRANEWPIARRAGEEGTHHTRRCESDKFYWRRLFRSDGYC